MSDALPRPAPRRIALALYVAALIVYAIFMGDRLKAHSPDNHFAWLADAYLHGTLSVRCEGVPQGEVCPPGGGGNDWARYNDRWFVAFPSLPAVVYAPAVALFGRDFPNRILDLLLAALAPALLYLLLERLAERGHTERSWRENVYFSLLFAFGTVFFFTAVQGSVWFVAHVVGCSLAIAYVYYGLDAASPLLAGTFLGLCFHTRTSMLFGALFFGFEALRVHRLPEPEALLSVESAPPDALTRLVRYVRGVDWPAALKKIATFSAPVLAFIGLYMLLNHLRFGDFREPGYKYLQIRWQARILRWGLFNYHYLSRNLAIALTLLPFASRVAPYVQISRHGLALWVTTPQYLELVRPVRTHRLTTSFAVAAAVIAVLDLLYQNSGWVQFGFRFSNDFAVFLVCILAVSGRPIRRLHWALLVVAMIVNGFGAATFDRPNNVYVGDNDFNGMFQPD